MRVTASIFIIVALIVPACARMAASEPLDAGSPVTVQVIVGYRDPTFDPSRGDYLTKLSMEIGVTVLYVRPMSGHAHILRLTGRLGPKQTQEILGDLSERPEVRYAEEDRQRYPMKR